MNYDTTLVILFFLKHNGKVNTRFYAFEMKIRKNNYTSIIVIFTLFQKLQSILIPTVN